MQIDLHGYHPAEIVWSGVLTKLVEQAWEMGERELILIHGHGRNRGITPGFVNTNTGFFGLQIRSALRHDKDLRRWVHRSKSFSCRKTRAHLSSGCCWLCLSRLLSVPGRFPFDPL